MNGRDELKEANTYEGICKGMLRCGELRISLRPLMLRGGNGEGCWGMEGMGELWGLSNADGMGCRFWTDEELMRQDGRWRGDGEG